MAALETAWLREGSDRGALSERKALALVRCGTNWLKEHLELELRHAVRANGGSFLRLPTIHTAYPTYDQ